VSIVRDGIGLESNLNGIYHRQKINSLNQAADFPIVNGRPAVAWKQTDHARQEKKGLIPQTFIFGYRL
jgi:hypothetical protein